MELPRYFVFIFDYRPDNRQTSKCLRIHWKQCISKDEAKNEITGARTYILANGLKSAKVFCFKNWDDRKSFFNNWQKKCLDN